MISRDDAVQMICGYMKCSVGRAQKMLHQACVIDAEVRWSVVQLRAGQIMNPPWSDAEFIDHDDLADWLSRRAPEPTAHQKMPTAHRNPGDAALVERGVKMVTKEGLTASEAGRRLASEAAGVGDKAGRLRKLIGKRRKELAVSGSAKHRQS